MVMAFITAAAVVSISIPYIKQVLEVPTALKENYLGEIIPTGMGIGFLPSVLAGSIVLVLSGDIDTLLILILSLGIVVMSFAGIVDDFLDDGSIKGLKGHIGYLFRGRLTTGSLKAVIGVIASILISMAVSTGFFEGILNSLLFVLMTNLINLLDLRPGRAIKTFFLAWMVPYLIPSFNGYWAVLLPLAGTLVAYFPFEMERKGMMGDAGSNGIGAALGIYYCLGAGLYQKAAIVITLALLHFISERYSFTGFIHRNKVLRYIDGIGSKEGGHV